MRTGISRTEAQEVQKGSAGFLIFLAPEELRWCWGVSGSPEVVAYDLSLY
jgi:hypothetical protein